MFEHIGMLRLRSTATAAERDAIVAGLRDLVGAIPGLVEAHAYPDAGLREGTADVVFRMVFTDQDAWVAYGSHPAHQAVIRDRIGPVLESTLFAQVQLS